jgi:hypothetical protein
MPNRRLDLIAAGTLVLGVVGCGGKPGGSAADTAAQAGAADLKPCQLLTADQVTTVLPGHDEGFVAHAGGSLVEGVDAYQCSYTDSTSNILTVVVNRAADDARFETIKPDHVGEPDVQKVGVADGGWVWGDDDDWKVQAVRGRSVIDIELMAPHAKQKSDQLVGIAGVVAAQL